MAGKQKTTQTTQSSGQSETNPADWASQNYHTGVNDALSAYQSGKGSQVYQGQRVVDQLSPQTQAGQRGLLGAMNDFADKTPSATRNLQTIAQNGGNNPYFQQALNNTLANAGNQATAQAGGQGLSTGAGQQTIATTLGRVGSQALSDQFNTGVQQQLAANQQIDNAEQNYARTKGDLAGENIKGGLLDTALEQGKLAAEQQKFSEEQMQPWKQLGLLGAATNTFAGQYGKGNTQSSGTSTGTGTYKPGLIDYLSGGGQAAGGLGGLLGAL